MPPEYAMRGRVAQEYLALLQKKKGTFTDVYSVQTPTFMACELDFYAI